MAVSGRPFGSPSFASTPGARIVRSEPASRTYSSSVANGASVEMFASKRK
jgi:hypothetical protein